MKIKKIKKNNHHKNYIDIIKTRSPPTPPSPQTKVLSVLTGNKRIGEGEGNSPGDQTSHYSGGGGGWWWARSCVSWALRDCSCWRIVAWLASTVRMSARRASISCVRRTRCSWVSSQNASDRSVRASTGSSKSEVGLDGATCEGCCGGGGGG